MLLRARGLFNHVDPYAPHLDLRAVNSLDNEIQSDACRYVDHRYSCRATCNSYAKLGMTAVIHVSQRPTIRDPRALQSDWIIQSYANLNHVYVESQFKTSNWF